MRERRRNYSWRKKERGSRGEGKVVELIRERERGRQERERRFRLRVEGERERRGEGGRDGENNTLANTNNSLHSFFHFLSSSYSSLSPFPSR